MARSMPAAMAFRGDPPAGWSARPRACPTRPEDQGIPVRRTYIHTTPVSTYIVTLLARHNTPKQTRQTLATGDIPARHATRQRGYRPSCVSRYRVFPRHSPASFLPAVAPLSGTAVEVPFPCGFRSARVESFRRGLATVSDGAEEYVHNQQASQRFVIRLVRPTTYTLTATRKTGTSSTGRQRRV